jgi:RNA-directed DNA polymerase
MKEPYSEGIASHAGPESCADGREAAREALTGVCAGRVLSPEKDDSSGVPTPSFWAEGNIRTFAMARR